MSRPSRKQSVSLQNFALKFKIFAHQVWFYTETFETLHAQLISNKMLLIFMDLRYFIMSKNSRNLRTFSV